MKTKLVLWGTDAEDKRVLIAMELKVDDNRVVLYTFPEAIASDEFADLLMRDWRDGKEVPFPEGYASEEKELTVTESLLPETLKVERTDIIQRAQTEWHFIVLSSKMSAMYASELSDIKTRVEKLEKFDGDVWDELKTFWDKVQQQVRERNLFREHADNLRDNTNALFNQLKEMRAALDEEYKKASQSVYDKFESAIQAIEEKAEKGSARLQSLFDELKTIQRDFRDANLTRDHRSSLWERIDAAFKAVKVKRFGAKAADENNPSERLDRRYTGLLSAIEKMEKSIKRDQDDLNFQKKKIDTTDGQLEAQIRQAKIMMIEERIRSKEEKLNEMLQTKADLDNKMSNLKAREAERAAKEKIEAAKEAVKEKIAENIKHAAEAREEDSETLEKAAAALSGNEEKAEEPAQEEKKESLLDAVEETVGEALEDVVDTVKAVASVVSEKIEEAVEDLKERFDQDDDEPAAAEEEVTAEASAETDDNKDA